jgi:hypothetical protein
MTNRLKHPILKKCIFCGKEFEAYYISQITCSVTCRNRKYQKTKSPIYLPRKCRFCGKEFYAPDRFHSNQQHCSKECARQSAILSRKRFYERSPERILEYRETAKIKNKRQTSRIDRFFHKYPEISRKCMVCGEDKVIDLHHFVPRNGAWALAENCTPKTCWILCPNHHAMIERGIYTPEELGLKLLNEHPN